MRFLKWFTGALLLIVAWSAAMYFGATEGWFRQPIAPTGDARAFMDAAVAFLEEDESARIAFVLVESGQIFDTYYSEGVESDTLFPVASMSKWFTAYGVMTLVQAGKIDLVSALTKKYANHRPDSHQLRSSARCAAGL